MNEVAVSIICNAYNHERYIRDALDSFVKQKTDFPYEILVHDDASTDKTAEIIKTYEMQHPDLIKAIYQTENQYSKRPGCVSELQSQRVAGKYIALCEGDDYWIDEYKLQKQYDALEKNENVDICATAAINVESESKKFLSYITPKKANTVISQEEVIEGGGGYVATASLMYRSELDRKQPGFRIKLPLDYTIQIHGALRGGMLYLSDVTAAYRCMSKESWTSRYGQNTEIACEWIHRIEKMLEEVDRETEGKYSDVIKRRIQKYEFELLRINADLKILKSPRYCELYQQLDNLEKAKIYIKHYFPKGYKLFKKIKSSL